MSGIFFSSKNAEEAKNTTYDSRWDSRSVFRKTLNKQTLEGLSTEI